MRTIETQPNLRPNIPLLERHHLPLPECCPVSGNPQPGSTITVSYRPKDRFLEVYSLREYIDEFVGGYEDVRDMEGMIQKIAFDCCQILGVYVRVDAKIVLQKGDLMHLVAKVRP